MVNPEDVDELAKCLIQSGRRGGVVIIDTLARAAAGLDENASRDMGQIIQAASKLQDLVGGLVVLVHHTGKDGNKGPRGHSSFMASLDAAIRVDQKGRRRTWTLDKAKDAEDGKEHDFELEKVNLGVDDLGNQTSSCVVVPVGGPRSACKSDQIPRGEFQEFVWKVINHGHEHSTEHGKSGAPDGRPRIHITELLELAREQLTHIDRKRVPERIKKAIEDMLKRGLITGADGWYWFPNIPENSRNH